MKVITVCINKIGGLIRLTTNKYMDYRLINNVNILNHDISPTYNWSTITQSIDYIYLKYSLKRFKLEKNDVVLDLGSGKGRILLYLYKKYSYLNLKLFGVELNKEAFLLSVDLVKDKDIYIYNENALDNRFIFKNKITKIILFNPFNEEVFEQFIKYLLNDVLGDLAFIYINISKGQIDILKKYNILYELDNIDKPIIGIYNKVNAIGYINEKK